MRNPRLSSARSSLPAQRAAAMRRAPSEPERLLWAAPSGSQQGAAFRRQAVFGSCIVDFVASAERLIVEVDGRHHELRRRADARRDRVLERAGYRVVRFTAQQVLHELASVVERIRAEIAVRKA